MEGITAKQVNYGHSCARCKTYFVTTKQAEYVCPWCQRIEAGSKVDELYESPEKSVAGA
jgi:uncharacterized Zn finger protein (UPF0148 family)